MMRLYNCDWRDAVRSMIEEGVRADLVVTDPPYELETYHRGKKGGSLNKVCRLEKSLESVNPITESGFDLDEFCELICGAMNKINIYVWCNKRQIVRYFNYFVNGRGCLYDVLFWNKSNSVPSYGHKYLTDCEYCLYFRDKGMLDPHSYQDAKTVYYSPIGRDGAKYGHPTVKPLDFTMSMVRNSSKEGGIVFDPFMGSGTTGVAAALCGRDFVGCEIDRKHFATAGKRILEEGGITAERQTLGEPASEAPQPMESGLLF